MSDAIAKIVADVRGRLEALGYSPRGNCYEASLAAGILAAADKGRSVRHVRGDIRGTIHWWIVVDGESYDPTADQFDPALVPEDYKDGIPSGIDFGEVSDLLGRDRLTFEAFAAANLDRCESPHGFGHELRSWSRSDWMTAVTGELGEAANVVKKLNRVRDNIRGNKEGQAELHIRLRAEIGDTCIYLDLFAQSQGFSLADAVVAAFDAKSSEIGYPHRIGPGG